ncbi:FG-GAP repeat-containing protein, partial [Candidatus Magnetobacterium bavaricum]
MSASTGTLSWSSDGKTGTAVYNKDTQVVLTATPAQGVTLKAWTGCDTTAVNQCTVTMTTDKDVTVEFSMPVTPIYDFDGNGYSDVLWRNTTTGDVYIWLMKGTNITDGDYVVRGITEDWDIKRVADFNADGKSDIVWQNTKNGDVYMYLMDGTKIITHG